MHAVFAARSKAGFLDRAAIDQDRDAVFELHVASMKHYVQETYGWKDELQRQMFLEDWPQKRSDTRVVEATGLIVAAFRIVEHDHALVLSSVTVAPAYQGQGIGTEIVRSMLTEARVRRCDALLQVMRVNPRAQALYERLGFRPIGESKTHVQMRAVLAPLL